MESSLWLRHALCSMRNAISFASGVLCGRVRRSLPFQLDFFEGQSWYNQVVVD